MQKFLVPCDGSANALRALQYVISLAKELPKVEIVVLNVQEAASLREHAGRSVLEIKDDQAAAAGSAMHAARVMLDDANVPYLLAWRVGITAEEIVNAAHESQCTAIVMGTRGLNPFASALLGSTATKVLYRSDIPVTFTK